ESQETTKQSGKFEFDRDVPRHNDEDKQQHVSPMEKRFKADPRLAVKKAQQEQNCGEINQSQDALSKAGKGGAKPHTGEPKSPVAPPLITANRTKEAGGEKGAEDWFWHNDAVEQERAAKREVDESGDETVPIIAQPFTDQ